MGSSDGLEYLGTENGKRKYLARLVSRDPKTGKKILDTRRTIYANSKGDAQVQREKLVQEELSKRAGRLRVGERLRFAAVADEWFATIEVRGTRISWGSHLKALKTKFGDWWLDAMSAEDMQRHLANVKRKDGGPMANGTVNSMRDVLVKIWDYACDQGLARTNLAEGTRRRKTRKTRREIRLESAKRPKRGLTAQECPVFFAALRQHEPDAYPIIRAQFSLGCRFSEVSALRLEDVDLKTGAVLIRRGQVRGAVGPTKASYDRLAALGPEALGIVKRHRRQMEALQWPGWDELVFPRPPGCRRRHSNHWSITTLHHAIKRTLKRLGWDVRGSTHIARHTANNLGRRLDETTNRLTIGHQNVEETLTYAMATPEEATSFAASLESAMTGGSSGGRDSQE